jgi:anthranilate phosphoribosyltransferase
MSTTNIQQAIELLSRFGHLQESEAEAVMEQIMSGNATDSQIGAYLMALRMKGETLEEIIGSAKAMRAKSFKVPVASHGDLLDTCGTGGDRSHTFNISTTVAFVAAGAGVRVAKHGNRAASSKSGSADVLGALGVNLDITAEQVGECVDAVGIGFLFAAKLHPAMKHAITARKDMAIRTIFNILGPLTNPAGANRQLLGVFAPDLTDFLAHVLGSLGTKTALVVCGYGNLDELTITGPNKVSYLKADKSVESFEIDPLAYGFEGANISELRGDDPQTNARILRDVLNGTTKGAKRDIVLLNGGAALWAAGKVDNLAEGIRLAQDSLDSGAALGKLEELIAYSQRFATPA